MAGRPKELAHVLVTTTATSIYTVPVGKYTIITFVQASVWQEKKTQVWLVPDGGTRQDSNKVWNDVIPVKEEAQEEHVKWVLETGDTIHVQCEDNNSIGLRFDGIEVDV